jgi:type VI secretion system protein ImpF
MAELTPQERLQPFLLDRLVDDQPETRLESREKRVMSTKQFRKSVLRDLAFLLNSKCSLAAEDCADFPAVAKTVVNYGIPDIAGSTISGVSPADVERSVRNAILQYEPRIIPTTLEVRVVTEAESGATSTINAISLEIRGDLWSLPLPESLYVKTEVDLETGCFEVWDRLNG